MFEDEYIYFTDDLVERGFRSVHECFEAWNSTVFKHQFENYQHIHDGKDGNEVQEDKQNYYKDMIIFNDEKNKFPLS